MKTPLPSVLIYNLHQAAGGWGVSKVHPCAICLKSLKKNYDNVYQNVGEHKKSSQGFLSAVTGFEPRAVSILNQASATELHPVLSKDDTKVKGAHLHLPRNLSQLSHKAPCNVYM